MQAMMLVRANCAAATVTSAPRRTLPKVPLPNVLNISIAEEHFPVAASRGENAALRTDFGINFEASLEDLELIFSFEDRNF